MGLAKRRRELSHKPVLASIPTAKAHLDPVCSGWAVPVSGGFTLISDLDVPSLEISQILVFVPLSNSSALYGDGRWQSIPDMLSFPSWLE